MAFAVVQRRGEMGVRVALGAERTVVRHGVARCAEARGPRARDRRAAALVAGRLASRQVSGLLFGVTASDPSRCRGGGVLIVARRRVQPTSGGRAARVDPMVA